MISYHKVKEAHEAFLAMSKVDRIIQCIEDKLNDPQWLRKEFSAVRRNNGHNDAMELDFKFFVTTTENERNEISARLSAAGWVNHSVIDNSHPGNALLFVNLNHR